VTIITHGDDGLYAITDAFICLFNFQAFACAYAKMNLKYTPSDKGADIFSHKTWDEVDIGKRKFVMCEELGSYLAPLALTSIGKMLTIGVVSQMTIAEKRASAVADALMEFSQYGRKQYDDWVVRLRPLCEKWNVPFSPRPWYEAVLANRHEREYTAESSDPSHAEKLNRVLDQMLQRALLETPPREEALA